MQINCYHKRYINSPNHTLSGSFLNVTNFDKFMGGYVKTVQHYCPSIQIITKPNEIVAQFPGKVVHYVGLD